MPTRSSRAAARAAGAEAVKVDPKIETCWIDTVQIGFGITLYVCFSRNFVGPIGFVWGIRTGDDKRNRFDVFGSYVLDWARRFGVRTKINEVILETHDVIATAAGSNDGGEAFMKAFGYDHDKKRMAWSYVKPRRRAKLQSRQS